MFNQSIIIIGAGPAGLMAAQKLAEKGFEVNVYEQNKAAARKFLVAGHGGFNLTHNEPIDDFIHRYDKENLYPIIRNFDNIDTIKWLKDIGIETYVGSSGKIFPKKDTKPIEVLNAWMKRLNILGVKIHFEHKFIDFDQENVSIIHNNKTSKIPYCKLILALGGGSWQKTGSNALWIDILKRKNINIVPLQPANSGYNTTENYQTLEGKNLKNIAINFEKISKKGEIVFTSYGIEGSPLYYLNRFTRKATFPFELHIDLKPTLSEQQILIELQKNKNITKILKEDLKFNSTTIQLLKRLTKEVFINPISLSTYIKNYPILVNGLRPIDEVISTAGGVDFLELEESLNLKKYPNVYIAGEMIDWEAPTGGYLLQACFSMGAWITKHILK